MNKQELFQEEIKSKYACQGAYLTIGGAMLDGQVLGNTPITIALKNLNRHGLIAGATGTGKTKTLQGLAESLSQEGVPTLLMDIKGDLSGIAKAGQEKPFITERHQKMNIPFVSQSFPVELLSLSDLQGVRLRATVSEFGSVLLSRILDLTSVQEGVLAVIFKYCDDNSYPLLDLKDLKKVLQFATSQGKKEFEQSYGYISPASTSAILRKIVELESQGADLFFGEKSFETNDLLRKDNSGKGFVNIIQLMDIQDKPKMFSTFMMCLLAEIYNTFPEQGDTSKPKLVIFIDEAHLIFNQASKALLNQLENIVKLIRSKGVGLIFCTQTPTDIPEIILSQLGLKIQHSLRAFTAKDRQAIKLTAQNYPETNYYNVTESLTSLAIGEALITALDEKGRPTPLVITMIKAPSSRMDILNQEEIHQLVSQSELVKKYNDTLDRDSAYEILTRKIEYSKKLHQPSMEKKYNQESKNHRNSKKQDPLIKLLTSASFIRGVFGVLNKVLNGK